MTDENKQVQSDELDKEALRLVTAFMQISDRTSRAEVIALAERLAAIEQKRH